MKHKRLQSPYFAALIWLIHLAACSGEEAIKVELPLVVDTSGLTAVTTDLGYDVTVVRARTALRDIQFTVEGEEHQLDTTAQIWNWLVPTAYAHPGHAGGGVVTGELAGNHIVEWTANQKSVGTATLLAGQYFGANFTFRRAESSDVLAVNDPLLGHTVAAELVVSRGEQSWQVIVVLDLAEDTELIGIPFDREVTAAATESIELVLSPQNPFDEGTLFDGIEFSVLSHNENGALEINPGQSEHNQIGRLFAAHHFYYIKPN